MKEEFPILEIASEKFPRAYSLLEESIDLEERSTLAPIPSNNIIQKNYTGRTQF